jgi:hypothetical protein
MKDLRKFIATTIREYLNEDAENDILVSLKGKKTYRTIVENLQNIIFVLTDENDTEDGIHLNGVKFNLNQLINEYDLNILFVEYKNVKPNNFYNDDKNIMVFFILTDIGIDYDELVRKRFKTWISETEFIHEFTHFLDNSRRGNTYNFKNQETDKEYFNSPEEYNAYYQEMLNNIGKITKKEGVKNISFEEFLLKIKKYGYKNWLKNLDDKYLNKLNKRLYKIYSSIK